MKKSWAVLSLLLFTSLASAEQKPADAQKYVYSADRFTDPFIPSKARGTPGLLQIFDPAGAQLGGLITTLTGKIAVLRTTAGATYIVKEGRLIDAAGRTVPGYYARVTSSSVIVWATSGGSRYVYPLRSNNEGVSR
jgi:hypothetical protein